MSVMANAARAALFGAVVSLVSIGASAADYTLSVNTALSQQDPLFKGLEEFKANVEKRSAGKMAVRLFPASQLGKDEDLLEQARAGAPVAVVVDGGELTIEWREADGHVLMTGPVAVEFSGVLPEGLA